MSLLGDMVWFSILIIGKLTRFRDSLENHFIYIEKAIRN